MWQKSLLLVSALAGLFLIGINSTETISAQGVVNDKGITISPIRFEYDVLPGESVTGTIKLTNATTSDKTVYLYTRNFESDGLSGTPLFHSKELPYTASLRDWINLDRNEIKVKLVQDDTANTEQITFTIDVPKNAEPGGHYAGIIATLSKPEDLFDPSIGNVAFKDERAAIILLNVQGDVIRSLTAEKFYATDAFTREKPVVRVFEWMPVGFITELRNIGNSHTVPVGNIIIYSGDSKVDEITFNQSQGRILRESSRTFFDSWNGALIELAPILDENGSQVKDENGNVQTRFQLNPSFFRMPFGKYNAKLAIGYDDGGKYKNLVQDFEFWVIPWKLLLAIAIILSLYIYYRIKKRANNKKKS